MSTMTESTATVEELDLYGGCPECGDLDGVLDTPTGRWGVCHEHRTTWFFEGCRYKGELPPYQLWANLALIVIYTTVDPFRPPYDRDQPPQPAATEPAAERDEPGKGTAPEARPPRMFPGRFYTDHA